MPNEIAGNLLNAIISAIVAATVAYLVYQRQTKKLDYVHVDQFYRELVQLYLENPSYANAALTSRYAEIHDEDEAWRYHCFAMYVHTFLETIYDLFLERSGKIDPLWANTFDYHLALHGEWLKENRPPFEKEYVRFALARFPKLQPAKLAAPRPRPRRPVAPVKLARASGGRR
jgi:hypothetical protein